jgi:hypothetical protein
MPRQVWSESRIGEARAVLAKATALTQQARGRRALCQLEASRVLLGTATRVLHRHVDALLAEAAATLARFDGLPVCANLLSVTGQDHLELAHSAVLAWLLQPDESHGLGDAMLRQLLARSRAGIPLALQDAPLVARVTRELPLDSGRLDIAGILPNAVFFIEVKVDDVEHSLAWRNSTGGQSLIYRLQLQDPDVRRRALRRFGGDAERIVGSHPRVIGLFLRRRGAAEAQDEETTSVDWLDVDEDLYRVESRMQLAPDVRAAIRAFRSVLLEVSGATTPPMPDIIRLRRLVDMPSASRADPLRTLLRLRGSLGNWENPSDE